MIPAVIVVQQQCITMRAVLLATIWPTALIETAL